MIRSMTGYGRGESTSSLGIIVIEIHTINRKSLEINISNDRFFLVFDKDIRQLVAQKLSRGRINVSISYTPVESNEKEFSINYDLAKDYLAAARELENEFKLENSISVKDLMDHHDIVHLEKTNPDPEPLRDSILVALELALQGCIAMREEEGAFLFEDIQNRLDNIHATIMEVHPQIPLFKEHTRKRLELRIREVLDSETIDETRLLTEVALIMEKSDITEELVRLNSHLEQFQNLLDNDEPSGRPLDFIIQEMFRETGTILAKSSDKTISQLMLEVKIELDKIREQIQNIE